MTHPFEIELETTLPATPEQVWDAIATGPGVDSWFMGRNEIEAREGGTAAMDTGGYREEAVVTAYDPGKRLATRTSPDADGRFMAFEYLLEGREGGSTVLRVVHSGMLGDDWENEYDALRRGWPFHLHTLHEYLAHFPGRTAFPVFGMAPTGDGPSQDVQALLAGALSLTAPVTTGSRVDGGPSAAPVVGGEVVWADSERFGVRSADALYTFHHGSGVALMFHHLFAPAESEAASEEAWQHWLTATVQNTDQNTNEGV
ncbi:Activator of Hsp90 ATPase 1 family protein [Catenulispora acidiphila DSM 44928]|uniref:Activator of Hsp90 ATPase 1 family protein n=1 Tax=Catenulispora acidiphila (strain DSM 44928 / JCM 14897 / NBRC 102108 / NRRL B-24433 / ID139908) TaxID=479433 RepID=C7Q5T9_CATAD|nr:SRPBCC domain-containing protein [Catenulispora acidiphila]ACU70036.1 Activator of Hsp90 ATPase 1 family protein [Catenulispora acidiphila DSM 44928]